MTQDDFKHPSAEKWTLTTTREFEEHTPVHQDTQGAAGNVWRNKETDPHSRKRFLCADQHVPGSDAVAFVREERRSPAKSPRHDLHEHPSPDVAREQHLSFAGMSSSAKRTSIKSSRLVPSSHREHGLSRRCEQSKSEVPFRTRRAWPNKPERTWMQRCQSNGRWLDGDTCVARKQALEPWCRHPFPCPCWLKSRNIRSPGMNFLKLEYLSVAQCFKPFAR